MSKKEIPGFYYDPVKNRYFAITKDYKPPPLPPPEPVKKPKESQRKTKCDCLPIEQYYRMLHGLPVSSLRKIKQKCLVQDIKFNLKTAKPFEDRGLRSFAFKVNKTGNILAMQMRPDGCLYLNETLCLYDVKSNSKLSDTKLTCFTELKFPGCRFSSFTWNPTNEHQVLFSLVKEHLLRPGFMLKSSELSLLSENGVTTLKKYNKKIIECIAWNSYPKDNSLICSGEKGGVVTFKDVNLYGYYVQPFVTKTAPQVMSFCKLSPCLFIGCKNGIVYQYDYRQYSPVHFKLKAQTYCVDCLYILKDENYIIVSNWNGDICKIDVRLRKTILEYKGHVNNHSKLNFLVDDCDNNLFAVGSDSKIRCWDIATGDLEYVHPITKTDGMHGLPILEYSKSWGGDGRLPGLLCSYDNKFDMWPLIC